MDYNITTFTLSSHHNPNNYVFNGKIMLCSVIILFVVVVVLVCFHSYARWRFHRHHRRRRPYHHFFVSSTTNTNNNNITSTVPHQALDLSILKSIPTFIYSSTIQKQQLECAVCLSEFEDDEKGRVLPQCNHSFHVDCIEMWFHSHSNCPLCRTLVQANSSVHPPAISVEEVVSVTEPVGSIIEREEGETGCSSSSFPPLELVGVLVELPRVDCRGLDEMDLGSPEESGFKSPGNRVLALKRIWST